MKPKRKEKSQIQPDIRAFQRGCPLMIQDGKVDAESIIQTANFLSGLYKSFEHRGNAPVKANIELTVIIGHED